MLGQSKKLQPIWSGPWMTQVISSVLYRIVNRKRSMVARDISIWLLRKRHELTGEDVGDRVLDHATDALGDPDEHGNGDDLGLEDLFAEMTEEGRLLLVYFYGTCPGKRSCRHWSDGAWFIKSCKC